MHHLDTTMKTSTGNLGGLLKSAMRTLSSNGSDTLAKMHVATIAPTPQRPVGGLYAPMFAFNKAAAVPKPVTTAASKPAPLSVKPPLMRAPGEATNFGTDFNPENPLHVHAKQLHESAAAQALLLASFKAVFAGPGVNPSTGPVAL